MADPATVLRKLPAVDRIASSPEARPLYERFSRDIVVEAIRRAVDDLRASIRAGGDPGEGVLEPAAIIERAGGILDELARSRLRRVVNASGVVLHTNLGRALLAPAAIEAMIAASSLPVAVEYDLQAGRRGERDGLVEEHLCALTGARAATVVNNNAAAVLLVLNTLADGREVIVSRGELVEIGGSFRIPDVMAKSGARLREVGTTNRTHRADYAAALGPQTAVLLKVHPSNYRVVGFTAAVGLEELRDLCSSHPGIDVVEDLGSGALVDLRQWGLPHEPVVADRLALGADLVTFSGDKLLGGPQCGVIVGRADLIGRIRANPLRRALRCDKATLAALEATLRLYRFDPAPERAIPTLAALVRPVEELEKLGAVAADMLRSTLGEDYAVVLRPSQARVGSGAQPDAVLPSVAIAITSRNRGAEQIAAMFRAADPPVVGRIEAGAFLLDLRTIASPNELVPGLA